MKAPEDIVNEISDLAKKALDLYGQMPTVKSSEDKMGANPDDNYIRSRI